MMALSIDKLSLCINGQVLFAPLSLCVEPGSITSIIGASGVGKSSLLDFLCGILPPEITAAGSARIGNEDIGNLPPQARGLGRLFQEPLLFPHLDVAGNLLFGLRRGNSRRERRERVAAALASVGLEGFEQRDPMTLSGGQQARVALLRVLLAEPRALLLDEPFHSLDDDNRRLVRDLVFAKAKQRDLPTLLVTHDQEDVAAACGAVIQLQAHV